MDYINKTPALKRNKIQRVNILLIIIVLSVVMLISGLLMYKFLHQNEVGFAKNNELQEEVITVPKFVKPVVQSPKYLYPELLKQSNEYEELPKYNVAQAIPHRLQCGSFLSNDGAQRQLNKLLEGKKGLAKKLKQQLGKFNEGAKFHVLKKANSRWYTVVSAFFPCKRAAQDMVNNFKRLTTVLPCKIIQKAGR